MPKLSLRRLSVLAVAAAAVALVRARVRRPGAPLPEPEWPPMAAPRAVVAGPPAAATAPTRVWVAPADGTCPEGYPVKANDASRIYHVPGGRSYDRTKPQRCYATSADAERDGYRAAKA
jgi:hypothetical protein